MKDSYLTISKESESETFKEKGSKFIAYAYPITSPKDVKAIIQKLRKEHFSARHCCYAWRIGHNQNITYRANDDGEPSSSAGLPIYNQILSKQLSDVLVVVVRYFGGTLLGVPGLVKAYKTASAMVLEQSDIIEKLIEKQFLLRFDYKNLNNIIRLCKQMDINIISQKMEESCELTVSIRLAKADEFTTILKTLELELLEK